MNYYNSADFFAGWFVPLKQCHCWSYISDPNRLFTWRIPSFFSVVFYYQTLNRFINQTIHLNITRHKRQSWKGFLLNNIFANTTWFSYYITKRICFPESVVCPITQSEGVFIKIQPADHLPMSWLVYYRGFGIAIEWPILVALRLLLLPSLELIFFPLNLPQSLVSLQFSSKIDRSHSIHG